MEFAAFQARQRIAATLGLPPKVCRWIQAVPRRHDRLRHGFKSAARIHFAYPAMLRLLT